MNGQDAGSFDKLIDSNQKKNPKLRGNKKVKWSPSFNEETPDLSFKAQLFHHKEQAFKWVRTVVIVWLVFVGLVISAVMVKFYLTGETFSPAIMATLLGTTTLNILGLPLIVLRNLFPNEKNNA